MHLGEASPQRPTAPFVVDRQKVDSAKSLRKRGGCKMLKTEVFKEKAYRVRYVSTIPLLGQTARDLRLLLSTGTRRDLFGSNSLHVSASPLAHRFQCALERPAIFRQRVFHFRRNRGVNAPRNDAIGLQLAELLDEHLFGNSRNQPAQLRKAICILMQPPQNQSLPLATNHVDRCLHRTVIRFNLHERLPHYSFGKYHTLL